MLTEPNTQPSATRPSELESQLSVYNIKKGELDDCMGELEIRLSSVLRNPPELSATKNEVDIKLTKLGQTIRDISDNTNNWTKRIKSILDRLEI